MCIPKKCFAFFSDVQGAKHDGASAGADDPHVYSEVTKSKV